MGKIKSFITVPPEIKPEFWEDTVQRNRISMSVICIMIFGMELYNIFRVLFMSASGLGTLNNRIYFAMYCSLFIVAAIYMMLINTMKSMSTRGRWALQCLTVLFMFLWHVSINAYDLSRNSDASTTIFLTAALGLGIFIQMPAVYAGVMYAFAWGLFMALTNGVLDTGDKLNCTISTIVALAISVTNCHSSVIRIAQHKEINEMNQRLHELLQRDSLTGVMNRAAFKRSMETALAEEPDGPLTMIIADIDDFKSVNDRYGHPCGDYVLREFAHGLGVVFTDACSIGRMGGDEFTVMLRKSINNEDLTEFSRRLAEELSDIAWNGHLIGVTCSMGACIAAYGADSFEHLYASADGALYSSKGNGRGRISAVVI